MALSVVNNVASLTAQNNLTRTSNSLSKSLERLSSGLKVNRGADGPAALVISEQQRAQITGLNAAIDNTTKAVSLVQTGEGALNEINSLLRKIRGLALDSANSGVNDSNSLAANQAEINNALSTIDRISNNTQFGTKKLLDGSSAATVTIGTTGATNLISAIAGANTAAGTYNVAISQQGQKAQLIGTGGLGTISNVATTTSGVTGAITGNATITATGANATQTGNYSVVITQQGVKGAITAAAAGAAAAATGTITFTGGLLASGTAIASITNGDSLATQQAAIQSAFDTALGANVYTVNLSGGVLSLQSNKYGAETNGSIRVSAVSAAAITTSTGFAVGNNTNQVANASVQTQISGGNLSSPISVTGSGTAGDQISVSSGVAQGLAFTVRSSGTTSAAVGSVATVGVAGSDTLTLNGTTINLNAQNAINLATAVNTINQSSGSTQVSASAFGSQLVLTSAKFGGTNFTFSQTGGNTGITNGQGFFQSAQDLQAKIYDANGTQYGGVITGSGPGGNIITAVSNATSNFGNADGLSFTFTSLSTTVNGVAGTQTPAAAPLGGFTSSVTLADALVFQIGANASQTASVSIQKTTSDSIGLNVAGLSNPLTNSLSKIDVKSASNAQDSIKIIDQAINDITSIRGKLGAFQANTLESTANNLRSTLENTVAAESNIRDTDFASETAAFTKNQVLIQAGTAVLQNANQTAQLVLSLLK